MLNRKLTSVLVLFTRFDSVCFLFCICWRLSCMHFAEPRGSCAVGHLAHCEGTSDQAALAPSSGRSCGEA